MMMMMIDDDYDDDDDDVSDMLFLTISMVPIIIIDCDTNTN